MEIILKDIVCNSTKADKCLNKINYTFKENSINFCSGLSGRLLRDLLTLKKQRESGFIFVNPNGRLSDIGYVGNNPLKEFNCKTVSEQMAYFKENYHLKYENVTEKIKEAVSCFKKGIIFLVKFVGTVLANTYKKLQDISSAAYKLIEKMGSKNAGIIAGSAITTTALTVGGVAAGSVFATSSVTVLGSQALGGVALALGVVSAPVWPIVVLGVAGGTAGVVIGKLTWDYFNKSEKPEALLARQLLLENGLE